MTHWQNFYHGATAEELLTFLDSPNQETILPVLCALQALRLSLESSMENLDAELSRSSP
jgi:hypothetical protein